MAFVSSLFANEYSTINDATSSRWMLPAKFKPGKHWINFFVKNDDATQELHQTVALKKINRRFIASGASIGLATSGMIFAAPAAALASIPFTAYVFIPVFKQAGRALGKDKKINFQVLIATRVFVSIAAGYTLIASIDALLQAISQRKFTYNTEKFQQTMPTLTSKYLHGASSEEIKMLLAKHSPDQFQQISEQQGERIAPWMMASFVLTTPLIGVAHAAAFLTTTFGAYLSYLGPYTARRFMLQATHQNALILQIDTLRRMSHVNTLVVDVDLLKTEVWQSQASKILQALKECNIHVISSDLLSDSLDTQAYCYISQQNQKPDSMPESSLSIYCGDTSKIKQSLDIDIILLENNLDTLPALFKLANAYISSQKFNQITPDQLDIVDIGTTLLLKFNLMYSLIFTYSGLLLGAANVDRTLHKYQQLENSK